MREWRPSEPTEPRSPAELPAGGAALDEPDVEVATFPLEPQMALYVTNRRRMIAAVELITPRNKDRPESRQHYAGRYLGYMQEGAHLLLVDVHRRPLRFSFADSLLGLLGVAQPPTPAPLALALRVGEPAAQGGRLVAVWRRPLRVGEPLPSMPLPLSVHAALAVDLEATYTQAAEDASLT